VTCDTTPYGPLLAFLKGMKNRLISLFFLSLLLFVSSHSYANTEDEINAQKRLCDFLLTSDKKLPLDSDPAGFSVEKAELRRLFLNAKPEDIHAMFQLIPKSDLEAMYASAQKKDIQLTDDQMRRFTALMQFVGTDRHNTLWDKDGAIRALHTHHADFRPPGHQVSLGGSIGGLDTSTLTSLEAELMRVASGQTSPRFRRAGIFKRLFYPQYYQMKRILTFFNWIRHNLDHVEEVGGLLNEVMHHGKELALDQSQIEIIKQLHEEMTIKQRARVRALVEKIIGQDIFTGGFQGTGTISLYDLAQKINAAELPDSWEDGEFVQEAERALAKMSEVLNDARKKIGKPKRLENDFFDSELKVYHRMHNFKADRAEGFYGTLLNQYSDTKLYVEYKWTEIEIETETYTDSNGKTQTRTKTKTVTKYGSGDFRPTFNDIILHGLSTFEVGASFDRGHSGATITSVTGLSALKSETSRVHKREYGYYATSYNLEQAIDTKIAEQHLNVVMNPEKIPAYVEELKKDLNSVIALVKELEGYLKWESNRVSGQWLRDRYEHFQMRNKQLLRMTHHLKEHYEIYIEQVLRKQVELVITPDMPDYSKEMGWLKFWMVTNYINAAAGLGASGYAGLQAQSCVSRASYINYYTQTSFADGVSKCVQGTWNDVGIWLTNLLSQIPLN